MCTSATPTPPNVSPIWSNGVDLRIEPGETMALVGLTGSGKSTITALVSRLYDIDSGAITLDGVDIRELRLDELRSRVAMAFEDATLFSATVRENVLLGRPDAGEDALAEALRIAQAQFVHDLPDGLDTVIGEEGLSLSGGQRQRLALARAVAARPSVLVLDDPLSALDVETEELVESALRHVLASTTALIVAHRPSTVMLADRVAVLEDGRITRGRPTLRAARDQRALQVRHLEPRRGAAVRSRESGRRIRRRRSDRCRRGDRCRGGARMTVVTGVTGEERDDLNRAESTQVRRRSQVLLGSLLVSAEAPHRPDLRRRGRQHGRPGRRTRPDRARHRPGRARPDRR